MAISDNIKRLRESFGLTQIQLGAIAGVSDKAVSTWERGDNIPRMGAIQRMADYFGVPKSAIIEEAASATAIPGIEHPTFHSVPLLGEIACGEPILAHVGSRMKERRKAMGLSAEYVAEQLHVSPATVYRYENGGIDKMPGHILEPLARILSTTPAYLMGWEEAPAPAIPSIEHPTFHAVPLLGEIACGEPILAEENLDGKVQVDGGVACDFALRCKGDSMAPRLLDGDLVFIRQQPSVDNGQIAAVLIDAEATLKHVYVSSSSIQLVAENPAYAPIVLTGEDAENARILGKAVAYRRSI